MIQIGSESGRSANDAKQTGFLLKFNHTHTAAVTVNICKLV